MVAAQEQIELVSTSRGIPMRRVWAMPSHNTFDIPPIRALVKSYLYQSKVSVDPFARNKRWATYTNDLNPDTAADYHMDALAFLEEIKGKGVLADTALFDPPYSLEQLKRSYENIGRKMALEDGWKPGRWSEEKITLNSLMLEGGIVITCGWSSCGMGESLGYEIVELLLVCHGPGHYDTICTVERKVESAQVSLFDQSSR